MYNLYTIHTYIKYNTIKIIQHIYFHYYFIRVYAKVLYIDIDVHHGDGVQEAFEHNTQVITLSFHQYSKTFFPYSGNINENQSINVPLKPGIEDDQYLYVFKSIVRETMLRFNPSVIVLQCGADSLAGDPIGSFNLSIKGHAAAVKYIKKLNIPMLVLGGGGYNIQNVVKCWTYETAILCNVPTHKINTLNINLHNVRKIKNQNTKQYLDNTITNVLKNINCLKIWQPNININNSNNNTLDFTQIKTSLNKILNVTKFTKKGMCMSQLTHYIFEPNIIIKAKFDKYTYTNRNRIYLYGKRT